MPKQLLAFLSSVSIALPVSFATAQSVVVTAVSPARHATNVPRNAAVSATLSQVPPATVATALRVFSQQSGGRKAGTGTSSGNTVRFAPMAGFKPGETVAATLIDAAGARYVWQFTAAAGTGPGTFGVSSTVNFLSNSYELELGDLNNDGSLDLAANSGGVVKIRFNAGNGTFTTGYDLPANCTRLILGDVDNDEDLDVLTTSYGGPNYSSLVHIQLNNGQGGFSGGTSFQTPSLALDMALGDIDADGDLDLTVATDGSSTPGVAVHLNNGAGVFTTAPFVSLPDPARQVRLTDVDNDGDLDLLAPFYSGTTVHLRLNNGNGSFSAAADITVGQSPFAIATGDLDADGDADFVTANVNGTLTLSVATNNGSGTFTVATLNTVENVRTFKLADLDGDGDLDILTDEPSLMENQGSGRFVRRAIASSGLGIGREGLAIGDVDGDNDLDFVGSFDQTSVFKNQLVASTKPVTALTSWQCWPIPVPASEYLHLTFAPLALPATVTLRTTLGTVVRSFAVSGSTADMSVAGIASGVYILTVERPGETPRPRQIVIE